MASALIKGGTVHVRGNRKSLLYAGLVVAVQFAAETQRERSNKGAALEDRKALYATLLAFCDDVRLSSRSRHNEWRVR